MLVLTNTAAQVVQPGQAIVFNEVAEKSKNCCECVSPSGTSVKLAKGNHLISFNANLGGAIDTQPSLALALGGEPIPWTTMTTTLSTATNVFNVGGMFPLKDCCCDFDRLSVINTGTTPVTVAANVMLAIERKCAC